MNELNLYNIPCKAVTGKNVLCTSINGIKYTHCFLETLMVWANKKEKEVILAKLN